VGQIEIPRNRGFPRRFLIPIHCNLKEMFSEFKDNNYITYKEHLPERPAVECLQKIDLNCR